MLFKNSVRTSKRTPHLTITKINWLMLFKFNTGVITKTPMWRTCYEEVCYKFRPWGNLLFIVSESKRDDNSVMFAARRHNPIQTGGSHSRRGSLTQDSGTADATLDTCGQCMALTINARGQYETIGDTV
jgi:hypothetical protein